MEKPGSREKTRDEYGRWLPGVSGNPSGAPKGVAQWRQRCRDFMSEQGWDILADMATKPGRDQRQVIELLAAYGFGKPATVVAGDEELSPIKVESRLAGLAEGELEKLAKKESPHDGGGDGED